PAGRWFLTVVAALEYMHGHPRGQTATAEGDESDENDESGDRVGNDAEGRAEADSDEEREARERDEAGANWLADQGFDRKD
ncbi:MAG: hypothetical protein LH616_18955, partial [Ilumatobacteraceae bacterium]|nr:hypothetical protein [Ilumatobacteraceae bacterium]